MNKPEMLRALYTRDPARALLVIVVTALTGILPVTRASAELSQPDHIFYGTAIVDGQPAVAGRVTLVLEGETRPIAFYDLGSGGCSGVTSCFSLRVPMTGEEYPGEPRPTGSARPGDRAGLFLDGRPAAAAVIGKAGEVQELVLDTDFLPRIPTLSIIDAAGAEELAGPFGLELRVHLRLSFPIDRAVTVAWQTVDGTATAGSDYAAGSGEVSFPAGQTEAFLRVTLFDDALAEADPAAATRGESFFVQLSDADEASLLDAVATVTILDDDTPPALAITNLTVVEPPQEAVEAAFRVSLSHVWSEDVSFDYSASSGTADGNDYQLAPASAVIEAGSLSTEIAVRILADDRSEGPESFRVTLAPPPWASLRPGGGRGTILEMPRLLTFVEAQRDGEAGADGLFGAIDLALSPDGRHLYVASRGDDALTVFTRDTATGQLTSVATYRDGEAGVESLGGVEAVAVSPDGERVYAAAFDDSALAVFERDATTGMLTLIEVERQGIRDLESGDRVDGLDGAIALTVVADPDGGEHLYLAGSESDALAVFYRDPADGLLSFEQVVREGAEVTGLSRAVAMAASPDGAQLYVASLEENAVSVFHREVDGHLSWVEIHRDGGALDGLAGAAAVAVAGDGRNVYVAGQDEGLAVFERTPAGRLSFLQAVLSSEIGDLSLTTDVAVSQDGRYVYVTGFGQDALAVFERAADGRLTWLETELDGEAGVEGLNGATSLMVSADDGQIYATGTLDNAVAVFRRDLAAPFDVESFISTSHGVDAVSADPVIELSWSGSADPSGAGLAHYRLFAGELEPGGEPIRVIEHGLDPHAIAVEQVDGVRVFRLQACDHAGHCSAGVDLGPFTIDTLAPTGTVATAGTSHPPSEWSNDPVIAVTWSQTSDVNGVAGYSWLFDANGTTEPDSIVDLPHGGDSHAVDSLPMADGESYFHLRACDVVGNCSAAIHLGPFLIDTVAPVAPPGLDSPSHSVDIASSDEAIDITWQPASDDRSGIDGYGVLFDGEPTTDCDDTQRIDGDLLAATSPALSNGDWYAHVCAFDRAGNRSAVSSLGPFVIETVAPTVVAIGTVADTGDGRLSSLEKTAAAITQITVTFSEPMSQSSATTPGSYLLFSDGDGIFDTVDCASGTDPADLAVPIDRVTYASSSHTAGLWLETDVALPAAQYRLLVCAGAIVDEAGNELDGDGTGGDFRVDFTVTETNLLRNPNFDVDTEHWTFNGSLAASLGHSEEDADAAPTSGSAELRGVPSQQHGLWTISQCVPLSGETLYRLGGRVEISEPDSEQLVFAMVELFAEDECSGPVLGASATDPLANAGGWSALDTATIAVSDSDSVSSARVSLAIEPSGQTDIELRCDNLFFRVASLVFADDFESGDLTRWSAAVP